MVESLPANAGDMGSSPGLGRSHMPRSNWARGPQLLSLRVLSLCVWSLCSATREAETVRGLRTAMKSGPRLPQLEKALAQQRRPNTAKNKQTKKQTNKQTLNIVGGAVRMHLNLRDQQFKIITYTYRLVYANLMVTTNQKCIIDTHTQKE